MMWRDCFTGKDNTTYDLGRVLWALGTVVFLALEAYCVVVRGCEFDMTTFGVGFSGLLMAGGGALLLKNGTEPEQGVK